MRKRKYAPRAGGLLPRMMPDADEEPIHTAIVDWLTICVPAPPEGPVWFHPYNGGYRTAADAGVGKALGVRAGIHDLIFLRLPPFTIEIKKRGETYSDNQEKVARELQSLGIRSYLVYGVEDVMAALRAEGVPFKETKIW